MGIFREPKLSLAKIHIDHCESAKASVYSRLIFSVDQFRDDISGRLKNFDSEGVFRSLLLHERINNELLYREVGFVHLFSASGIHLYVLLTFIFEFSIWLGLRFRLSSLFVRRLAHFLVVFIFFFSWIMAGFCFAMLRPLMVMSIRYFSRSNGLKLASFSPLVILGIFECCYTWFVEHSMRGLLHYFFAVGGGIFALIAFRDVKHKSIHVHFLVALGSWLFLAVFQLFEFGLLSPLTPIISLFSVPIFSLILYPWVLVYSFTGLGLFLPLFSYTTQCLSQVCIFLERSGAILSVSIWAVFAALFVSVILNWFNNWRRPVVFVGLVIFLISARVLNASVDRKWGEAKAVQIEQIDVGQGDAALVSFQYQGDPSMHFGMIDVGSARALSLRDWLYFFSSREIYELDFVAFSHLDEDHAGGIEHIKKVLPVKCVVTSQYLNRLKRTNWQGFDSKCFPFQVFEPNENFRQRTIAEKRLAPNAGMSGFLVPFKAGGTFISLGDSDSKREDQLALEIEKQTVDRPLFFKISHHGSRFSSRADFLKRLSPDEVVISSGVGNSFGHPYPGVIQNLLDRGVPIHRTDREGSVIFKAEVYRHQ